ncbi:MAG: S8 family serine peptidase [Wenzhouxiangella sp.]
MPADQHGRYTYMIEFNEPGLMELHRQTRSAGERFNFRAADMQAESQRITNSQQAHLSGMASVLGRSVQPSHFYQITHSGIAVNLTEREARQIQSLPNVASVERARVYFLDTFAGPEFIGAGSVWDGSTTPDGLPYRGEGMIAGVLDSGIVPNHPSFLNDPACGHGQNGVPNKLISFVDCSATNAQGLCAGSNPVDTNGHGTHVAGTVAGNALLRDSGPTPRPNPPSGDGISGVAKCAHIRNYKVCPGASCPGPDIQAGMNTLLADGDVDTMNFSISGGNNPWNDNDRRKLDLVDAGVFVNASAGNTNAQITNPVGRVAHLGPWVTSVAASTRPDGAAGVLSMTGPGTVPGNLQGIVMDRGSDSPAGPPFAGDIRFDADQPAGADGCDGFPAGFFDDAIALVQRGSCPFSDKINNAAAAGAQVVVIWNNTTGTINMSTPGQANVPAYSITQAQGQAFIDFINANPTATAAFTLESGAGGDVLAGFSLRGPTGGAFSNLQKPDITAPGVGIYAADVNAAGYGNKSGTSMSGPHLSGAAVLVRQMQPDWAPIEVGSALRMTAKKSGFKEGGANSWDWDDVGSGRVELTRAGLAGFVLNEVFDNFLAANPATGGDIRTLNLPALRDVNCTPNCTFTRTVRNTLDVPTSWTAGSEVISGSFNVSVSPSSFSFSGNTSETQELTITLTPDGTIPLSFGTIDFVEASGLSPDLHFTVALAGTGEGAPDPEGVTGLNFEGTVSGITGDPEGVWASDLRMNVTSPTGATFAVGGFGGGAAPTSWDFDGAGSAQDGTYNSSHPNVFGAGTDVDGEWTFQFIHTYAPGATMTWDPVTIELTGPARDTVLATINIPAFTINGGAQTSFTIPVGGPDPVEPEILVDPAALSATVGIDGTATSELTISNVGTGTLNWAIDVASTATRSTVLWEQLSDGTGGIVSDFFIGSNAGAYSASEFILSDDAVLEFIFTPGFDNTGSLSAQPAINWAIYTDNGGVPSGHPEDGTGLASAVWSYSSPVNGAGVSIASDDISLDLVAAGETLSLDAGTYWLTVYPSYNVTGAGGARWNWSQGVPTGSQTHLISPVVFGVANWTSLSGLGVAWTDTAFRLEGTQEAGPSCDNPDGVSWLSVDPASGSTDAGESSSVTVSFDADGLTAGVYEAVLCVDSNDAANPLVVVPVSFEVLAESAQLQVAHLAPFAADLADTEVDVALNGTVVLPNVPYGASTGALTVPAGTYDVQILLAGTSTVALEALGVELQDGVKYTAIASGDGNNQALALDLLVDDLSAPAAGNFKLRLGHLAPFAGGAASAEVRLADGTLIQAVDYRDITGFIELAEGSYDLQITAPGGDPVLIDPIELTFAEGDIISAFAVGDGANQSLGVYALPPTAPGFFVPLVGQAPEIVVDPASLSATVDEGDAVTLDLDISNIGAGNLEWSVVEDVTGSRVLQAIADSAQPITLPVSGFGGLSADVNAARGATSGPFTITNEGITLTHSASNSITAANTVACAQDGGTFTTENYFYRTFALGDFGIDSDFDVTEVTFGIENLNSTQPITINLYTLDGTFNTANLTQIGTATESLAAQQLTLVTIPVEGLVPEGGTLVVEIAPPDLSGVAAFFPGSNSAGETAPSYIRAPGCGIAQPTAFAGIGFPQVQLVLSVTGEVAGGAPSCELPSWVSVNPTSGNVAPGGNQTVSVTLDSGGLTPGSFDANLCIGSNDPDNSLVEVPLSLVVEALLSPPSIEVDPTELGATLDVGQSTNLALNVANLGDETLNFSAFTAGEGGNVRSGDELFVSGPLVTNPGAGVGGADVSAVQTGLGMTTFGAGVQQTAGNRMSDSFTVDGNWTVDSMTFYVYQTGSPPNSTITSVSLRIWDGAPNAGGSVIFGDDTTNRLLSTTFNGIYRALDTDLTNSQRPIMEVVADLEGLQLAPGTYWVDVSFGGSLASGPWMPPISVLGQTTTGSDSWQFTASSGSWVPWDDGGTLTRQGMPFLVSGSSGASCDDPSNVDWLSVSPTSGSVDGGDSTDLTVTLDSTGLAGGVYEALICLSSNDPVNPLVSVPVTLEVNDPSAAFLEGTVSSLGYCGENPFPAEGATIEITGADNSFTLTADENGFYSLTLDVAEAPLTITASAPDHISQTEMGISLVVGETTVVDFDLVLEAACATVAPNAFEIVVVEGDIAEDVLNIGNVNGAADLDWSIELEPQTISAAVLERFGLSSAVIREFTPGLNEVLDVPNFVAISAPNGGTPIEFTIPAGIASSGQVVGFTFEGTVAGISGNSTWASDMRMVITSPEGASYDVGGFSGVINPWDFGGAVSNENGTYTSTHVGEDVFGVDGTLDAGTWTIVFTNDWNSTASADMEWSEVTVTLHKSGPVPCAQPDAVPWILVDPTSGTVAAGDDADVSVVFDSTGVPAGQYGAFICVTTSDAENSLVPVPVLFDIRTDSVFQDRFESDGIQAKRALEQ